MILTAENYYSQEANMHYMSNSQYKAFAKCEAAAMAELRGETTREKSIALLVGGYVDAHFSDCLAQFRALNPEIFKKDGCLKAEYVKAEEIINRIERDAKMLEYLQGQQQVIMTGLINAVPFKIRMDSYFPGVRIVDGKTMKDFKPIWVEGSGKLPFLEAWGYDIQAAIYQFIEFQNSEVSQLPFFIAAATKEPTTDLLLLELPQHMLDVQLANVEHFAPLYAAIKRGEKEPRRCEHCDYCKQTRVIKEPMDYQQFLNQYGGGYEE